MVPLPPAAYRNPEVSPDGDLITYVVGGGAWSSNWTLDLQRKVPQRLHFEGSQGVMKWSPDKSRYVFAADPTGGTAYYMYLGSDGQSRGQPTDVHSNHLHPRCVATGGRVGGVYGGKP